MNSYCHQAPLRPTCHLAGGALVHFLMLALSSPVSEYDKGSWLALSLCSGHQSAEQQ